jgi:amidohydrolase
VISFGSIHGGAKNNVIPDAVVLKATVRTFDDETRALVREKIERTVYGLAEAAGAPRPELVHDPGTPSGYNDPELVASVSETAARVLGPDNVITYTPGLGGEDFSHYGRRVPGFQFRLGVGRPDRPMTLHSPDFDPDERSVTIGMRLVAEILWDQLHRP